MIVDSGTRYKTGELEDMILACPKSGCKPSYRYLRLDQGYSSGLMLHTSGTCSANEGRASQWDHEQTVATCIEDHPCPDLKFVYARHLCQSG